MPVAIARVGVVGAGQMGRGIAQVAATAGLQVTLCDASIALAESGLNVLSADLDKLVSRGKLPAIERDAIAGRIKAAGTLEALADADFVIEAVAEKAEVKKQVMAELDRVSRPGVVLASNTSSIRITSLAEATRRPALVVGMHFMNPVPLMKLCEIVRGLATSDDTMQTTTALAARLGKETVTSRDVPGFIVNRVLMPLINEAAFALHENVASAVDIDRAVHLGLHHPLGPLALADLIGLDTTLSILQVLHQEFGDDKYRPCPLLVTLVAAGKLGRKSGRGFFDYP